MTKTPPADRNDRSQKGTSESNTLGEAFAKVLETDLTGQSAIGALRIISPILKDPLATFLAGQGNANFSASARDFYDKEILATDKDYESLAQTLNNIAYTELTRMVQESFAVTDFQSNLKTAQRYKKLVQDMPPRELAAALQLISTLLPPQTRKLFVASGVMDDTPQATWVRNWIRNTSSKTAFELAHEITERAKKFPVREVTDIIYAAFRSATPQSLKAMRQELTTGFGPADFEKMTSKALPFALEIAVAMVDYDTPLKVNNPALVAAFGRDVHRFLSTVESAAVRAVNLDTDKIAAALRRAYGVPAPKAPTPPPPKP